MTLYGCRVNMKKKNWTRSDLRERRRNESGTIFIWRPLLQVAPPPLLSCCCCVSYVNSQPTIYPKVGGTSNRIIDLDPTIKSSHFSQIILPYFHLHWTPES
jgi:hypothetical protein